MKLLIIGGVAGGASAAARARRLSENAEIILFERGPDVSFANCGLPYHIGGEISERRKLLVTAPELLRDRFKLDVRACSSVEAIDRHAKCIRVRDLTSGREYDEHYDKLILAPGAAPKRYPPVRRLIHALTVARLVERARTKSLTDEQLSELFSVLERGAPEETADLFSNRQAASSAGAVIFRQIAAEFARLHPRFQTLPSWRQRWQLLGSAWGFVRGRGKVPRLHPLYPEATFEQLERPLGALDTDIMDPLTRMFEATAVSGSYALANRGTWSIVESLRMLTVLYPVGLWLLRWLSADRPPAATDMPEIISALDRGQGFASLAGYKQRRRVQVLAQLADLERLVAWYGR